VIKIKKTVVSIHLLSQALNHRPFRVPVIEWREALYRNHRYDFRRVFVVFAQQKSQKLVTYLIRRIK